MKKTNEEMQVLVNKATAGDEQAIERLIEEVQDLVFNLSLRMLGTFPDAQDATQDILLKMITHLTRFRGDSSFTTWVFSIASNHLKDSRKHMFAQVPFSFEMYGADIESADLDSVPDMTEGVDRHILAEELKMSCTNVMLQCLEPEDRCIFILGTMFKLDSRIAGEALGMTAEAYRQRLCRARRKMADFLKRYCGEYGAGSCRCFDRVNYAIASHRIMPQHLGYAMAEEVPAETMMEVKDAMEAIDELSQELSFCKAYRSPEHIRRNVRELLDSTQLATVRNA